MSRDLIIIGGSYAGLAIAAAAREHGYDGRIRMISDDSHPPYQRPPLSKSFIADESQPSPPPLRPASFLCDKGIEITLNTRVVQIDRRQRLVTTEDGVNAEYGSLAIAAGARARPLVIPGADLAGVVRLRTLADAVRLRQSAREAVRIAIVGGGFIGLEVASALAKRGKAVTVLETQDRLLLRAVGPEISKALLNLHRRNGVIVECGVSVREFEDRNGRVAGVVLADGRVLPTDLVVAAIGAVPNTEVAAASGIACDDGILVNEMAQTNDRHVFAAGDCARFSSSFGGGWVRLESVQNATDQGKIAGAAIAGKRSPYVAVPWFWSDQYDTKLQIAGLSLPSDVAYVSGLEAANSFSLFYFRGQRLAAVHALNRPGDYISGRKHLALGTTPRLEEVSGKMT